jgi:FtsP/CotA-like multicopper oxidase with cupredoxin domain
MAHPWHLHGFSFQPTGYLRHNNADIEHHPGEEDPDGDQHYTRWAVDYNEYLDTALIPPNTSIFYNVHIGDPLGTGGAAGRWLKHCHIFQHGEGGMISELIVTP